MSKTDAAPGQGANNLDAEIAQLKAQLSATTVQPKTEPEWWSATNAMTVSSAVLVFGLFVCCIAAYLVKLGKSSESVLKLFGTILVIVATLFLIVAGYSDKQIAPAMGLLGTVVGYLLGKEPKEKP